MNEHRTDPHAMDEPQASRFLSVAECAALVQRLKRLAVGGGYTAASVQSDWTGNLRWARNKITTSGDVRNNFVRVTRTIRAAQGTSDINQIDGPALEATVRRAERGVGLQTESPSPATAPASLPSAIRHPEPYAHPEIWSDLTYGLDAERRAEAMRSLVQPAIKAGMFAAGYLQLSAHGRFVHAPWIDTGMYYPYTQAQYSVTVRDREGTASGWAGLDHYDWGKIDAPRLSEIALEKCLRSRNPVVVEPGRWTVILEPQAVCDLTVQLFSNDSLLRRFAEGASPHPFGTGRGVSKIGERVIDERLTVSMDCLDPDLGFAPFTINGDVYQPVNWVERGVLKHLAYDRMYAVEELGLPLALVTEGAFRISGGTTSIGEMVETTKRGLLISRFSGVQLVDDGSVLCTGYTRDGIWLVENGKITKAVKNFRFTESPLFLLNNVEQLGVPQRVFHPDAPVVVPPIKARDFSLTSLADAV